MPISTTVIFLHGLGDSGHGWHPVAEMLAPSFPNTKFILPNAPMQPVSLNMGMKMPSWYDIYSLDGNEKRYDRAGIVASVHQVKLLVDEQVESGISRDRIVVGGFSQGGAVALAYAAMASGKLAGFIGLSTYLPLDQEIASLSTGDNVCTPVFMGHGSSDDVVGYEWGRKSVEKLESELKFMDVEFKTYPGMGHSSCHEEISDIGTFLKKIGL